MFGYIDTYEAPIVFTDDDYAEELEASEAVREHDATPDTFVYRGREYSASYGDEDVPF